MATTQSNFAKYLLKTLMNKISRRTTQEQSKKVMDAVFRELLPRYDFLRYITITDIMYSEAIEFIKIDPEINTVNPALFDRAIRDIIKTTIRHLQHDADFFFIREFREAIDDIGDEELLDKDINLSSMQFQYIFEKQHSLIMPEEKPIHTESPKIEKPKYDEIIKKVLEVLVDIVNATTDKKSTMSRMDSIIQTVQKTHSFLQYIHIDNKLYAEGMKAVTIQAEINTIESYVLAKAIRDIIKLTNASLGDNVTTFIESFKTKMGESYLLEIEKMGINLHFLQLKFV